MAGQVLAGDAEVRRGALALQFDDGWSSWRTLVAPQLARVGGRATGFVNNQYVANGRITLEDLRALQDGYGWEIGTHTYNHHHAVRFVQQHGLEVWCAEQLERSVAELRGAGLKVGQLVFPFNAYSPEIARAALGRGVGSYRRADTLALAAGRREDGSLPGTSIDLSRHLPLATLKQWVDLAHERDQVLFLYGHRVLPDEAFVTGRVVRVTARELVAEGLPAVPAGEDTVLVPDLARRGASVQLGAEVRFDGQTLRVPEGAPDLTRLTAPGATFLIGPAYGTRLSDFVALVDYAAARLNFYTVSEIVEGRHRAGRPPVPERGAP